MGIWLLPSSCRPPLLQGKKKVLENWHGEPSLGPGLPHRHGSTLPCPPRILEFCRSSEPCQGRWGSAQRTACQDQQQLCPIFSGSSQVISKLVLRGHGQGPEMAPKLVKTLAGFPARRNHQISHRSDSQGPFEYINHMLALGRVCCATCPENHTCASMTRTTEGNKGSESSGKSPDGTSTRDCCCSPSW